MTTVPDGSTRNREWMSTRNFWKLVRRSYVGTIAVNLIFIAPLLALGAHLAVSTALISVMLFSYCLWLVEQRRGEVSLLLAMVYLVGQMGVLVCDLGWDSGFHYYLLLLIPVNLVNTMTSFRARCLLAGLVTLAYLIFDAVSRVSEPWTPINPSALMVIRYLNISCAFGLLGFLSAIYLRTVQFAYRELRLLASTDALTGLSNRRQIMQVVESVMSERRNRAGNPMTVLLIDVDDFKAINDRYGHETGDQVLCVVADRLRSVLREGDSVARWGGEEFLILLPEAEPGTALLLAERARAAVCEKTVQIEGQPIATTITIGLASHAGSRIESTIAAADAALYQGKRRGKNRVELAA